MCKATGKKNSYGGSHIYKLSTSIEKLKEVPRIEVDVDREAQGILKRKHHTLQRNCVEHMLMCDRDPWHELELRDFD